MIYYLYTIKSDVSFIENFCYYIIVNTIVLYKHTSYQTMY